MVTVEMRRDAHLPFMRGSIFGKFPSVVQAENNIIGHIKSGKGNTMNILINMIISTICTFATMSLLWHGVDTTSNPELESIHHSFYSVYFLLFCILLNQISATKRR
jgi:hypothetical protein